MNRKILSIILAIAMVLCVFSFASCGKNSDAADDGDKNVDTKPGDKLKIGAILLGDENEGYTYAHIVGIKAAAEACGLSEDQIVWRYSVGENEACHDAAMELVDAGCTVIFSNSYGHQTYMQQAASEVSDVTFVAMTGDTANYSGLSNLCNAFTNVYESRYISGVVAGMKIKQLIDDKTLDAAKNFDKDGNVKIGYVGAYPYAEVVSGYTAFFLGIKSIVENVSMEVQYTNSWFDITAEGEAAKRLVADGCVIIGQHADSTGAPAAVQACHANGDLAFSIGYNIDMRSVAPDVALTSATNVWEVYYEYAIKAAMNGDKIAQNWAAGYAEGAVRITDLGTACADGTQEKVDEAIAAIKDGSLHVFDTSKFTVDGQHIESWKIDLDGDHADETEAVWDGYFHESELRSAPSFAIRIDGIEELNAD